MINIAINGFGRIGRMLLRSIIENEYKNISVLAINDCGNIHTLVHLLKYDSVHGRLKTNIKIDEDSLQIGDRNIKILSGKICEEFLWAKMDIDLVVDCTGASKEKGFFMKHITAGAKKVIVSTIIDSPDITVVYGINHKEIKQSDKILSNASCTSNCLITTLYPIYNALGIEAANITSIHSYTNDQSLVDSSHQDLRRARSVDNNIIPSYTNASKAIDIILPKLKDKIHCTAARVPVSNVSMLDCNILLSSDTEATQVNNILIEASKTYLNNVIECTDEHLVSVDYIHNPHSAIIDLSQTKVLEGKLCKIAAWYDNEWAYANRICDVINHIDTTNVL